jgi:hypothetical protein
MRQASLHRSAELLYACYVHPIGSYEACDGLLHVMICLYIYSSHCDDCGLSSLLQSPSGDDFAARTTLEPTYRVTCSIGSTQAEGVKLLMCHIPRRTQRQLLPDTCGGNFG